MPWVVVFKPTCTSINLNFVLTEYSLRLKGKYASIILVQTWSLNSSAILCEALDSIPLICNCWGDRLFSLLSGLLLCPSVKSDKCPLIQSTTYSAMLLKEVHLNCQVCHTPPCDRRCCKRYRYIQWTLVPPKPLNSLVMHTFALVRTWWWIR